MALPAPAGLRRRPDEQCVEPPLASYHIREEPENVAIPAPCGETGCTNFISAGKTAGDSNDRHPGIHSRCDRSKGCRTHRGAQVWEGPRGAGQNRSEIDGYRLPCGRTAYFGTDEHG